MCQFSKVLVVHILKLLNNFVSVYIRYSRSKWIQLNKITAQFNLINYKISH